MRESPHMSTLTVRGLIRTFGEVQLFSGLDIDVEPGTAVALVGPNGTGKTTVLRCITGADQPTDGTIEFNGQALDERSPAVRADLAIVMDDIDFFPDLSVVEHLDLIARAHSVTDAEAVVDAVLAELDLLGPAGQLPGTLSSGQRRRLALASAFVRPRRLLILDEPEQRLDEAGLEWLARRLLAEKRDGLAILMASHNAALVRRIADHVIDMDGRR